MIRLLFTPWSLILCGLAGVVTGLLVIANADREQVPARSDLTTMTGRVHNAVRWEPFDDGLGGRKRDLSKVPPYYELELVADGETVNLFGAAVEVKPLTVLVKLRVNDVDLERPEDAETLRKKPWLSPADLHRASMSGLDGQTATVLVKGPVAAPATGKDSSRLHSFHPMELIVGSKTLIAYENYRERRIQDLAKLAELGYSVAGGGGIAFALGLIWLLGRRAIRQRQI